MCNGNKTRKTTRDICLCLCEFLYSLVNILKLFSIVLSFYFCIIFAIVGNGEYCCFSKIQFLLDAGYVVCSVLSGYWACFGALSTNIIHSSLSLYNALSKKFAIGILLKMLLKKKPDKAMSYRYQTA